MNIYTGCILVGSGFEDKIVALIKFHSNYPNSTGLRNYIFNSRMFSFNISV